jgi:regulator of protease activity HflC (stomatin/prohibitin superfamily)
MDSHVKRIGLLNWIVLLAAALAMFWISRFVDSATGLMGAILTSFGLLVALSSYFQMRLEEREHFEKLELEELSKTRGSSIFASADADTFPARRSREQFERYFVPIFTLLLFVLQAAAAYVPWKLLANPSRIQPESARLAMALLGLCGLILFLLGKYASGFARLQKQRLLRPGAAYMLLSAYACFVTAGSIGAVLAGFPNADMIIARVLCVISGLIALETLLALVLEIYRVRVKGRETRLLYESRLVGLLGQPEAIITTAAHALDYQFGFKVSETWFYQFLEKALAWLILAQLGILVLSTCVVFIQPGEQALLERFGAPVTGREVIGPGLHFKLPWPIDQARPYATDRIQSFIVGAEPETNSTVLWSVPHAKEEIFPIANRDPGLTNRAQETGAEHRSPAVSFLAVSIPVQFQVTNLDYWAYNNEDPETLLKALATREVSHYLASADVDELMAWGRGRAREALRQSIQAQSDTRALGARITFVGLEDIHPPSKVAKYYEQFVGARETKEAKILDAEAHKLSTNALARAGASNILSQAEAAEYRAKTDAKARAALFGNQTLAYAAAPGIYELRAILQAELNGARNQKIVIATGETNQILEINRETKIRPDLLDTLQVPQTPPQTSSK